jgi:AmmeMemoRadiSam system protein A
VVLCAARSLGADRAQLMGGANSFETSGDADMTVGYGAALLLRSTRSGQRRGTWPTLDLSEEEGRELTALARSSLEGHLRGGRMGGPRLFNRPKFNLPAAVFVTWEEGDWKEGGLRGCIGTVEARETLGNAVLRYALASAKDDPRFAPITLEELPALKAEVTVLSPLRDIRPDEVAPGMGIQVARGAREGLFLPQVWEKFSAIEEFMSVLCRHKAGLPADAWRQRGTQLRAFSARCFK